VRCVQENTLKKLSYFVVKMQSAHILVSKRWCYTKNIPCEVGVEKLAFLCHMWTAPYKLQTLTWAKCWLCQSNTETLTKMKEIH